MIRYRVVKSDGTKVDDGAYANAQGVITYTEAGYDNAVGLERYLGVDGAGMDLWENDMVAVLNGEFYGEYRIVVQKTKTKLINDIGFIIGLEAVEEVYRI